MGSSRPKRMGGRCPSCGFTASDRSENINYVFSYEFMSDVCPKCQCSVHAMDDFFYYCDNCNKPHQLTTLDRFTCSCGWISLID